MAVTFGRAISDRRKAMGLSQKDLAARITKEDGDVITPQYLNDIEKGRRFPSRHLIGEFAQVLQMSEDYLSLKAARLPEDIGNMSGDDPERVDRAFRAFRRSLEEMSK